MVINLSGLSVDNKFRLICWCCAAMHLTFLLEFSIFGFYMMALFNVLSVILYICCSIECMKGSVSKHSNQWINVIFAEIVTNAFLCTVIQGLDVGFYVYFLLTIPVASYCLFFYEEKKKFLRRIISYTIAAALMLLISVAFVQSFGSIYRITDMRVLTALEINIIRSINIFYAMAALCAFSLMFFSEIFALLKKLSEKNDELEYIAEHDALTGLLNRHALWSFFDKLYKSGDSFCVIMGDIDDFKKVNDTYGHECGDLVLKSVAKIILDEVREGDIAVRWGGEEMLMMLRGKKSDILERTEKIRHQISELNIVHENSHVKVSMTFGVADFSELEAQSNQSEAGKPVHISTNMDMLISIADKRLYDGKNSGKNKVIA